MKRSVCLGLLLALMLTHSDYVTEGARNGLLLWYSAVVPALFPFMVLSGLIASGDGLSAAMEPFYRLLNPLLRLSRNGCYTLLAGLVCGYPMGAKTCADFLAAGRIARSEAGFLMAVSNYPSPMFILGYVYPLLEGRLPLASFLAAVYGPALPVAAAACWLYRPKELPDSLPQKQAAAGELSADEAILSAAEVLCRIGGYLILFSIGIVFLRHTEKLPSGIRTLLISSMEMTTGIREACFALPWPLSGAVSCAALTFGGFSGVFQTNAVIQRGKDAGSKNAGLSIRHYTLWKLLYGALSALLFFLVTGFLPLFP